MSSETLLAATVSGDRLDLLAAGDWTADRANDLERLVMAATIPPQSPIKFVRVNMADVVKLDTYGAWLLERLLRGSRESGAATDVINLHDQFRTLVDTVHQTTELPDPERLRRKGVTDWLAAVGENIAEVGQSAVLFAQMLGAVTFAFLRVFWRPRTFRFTSLVNQIDLVGWRAVPIILLITFLIGAILAQQGIFHFRRFGADVFVVDMVGILVLREIGVLIVCVMVAGRSGSAYTAEIGSMKMREEIDALQTMGFDPISVLVLPRILALVIAVPMLTFLGEMSALYGAGLVASLYGGIQPEVFLQRLREVISLDHFMVGMIKAPFMAMTIGIVACVRGLETKGSAESLGAQTTAAVVQSIFLVIVLDGVFAVFFAAIDK
ncbi:MAG: MlaE family ABC transporter permease [Pseudomonadota bacterium]